MEANLTHIISNQFTPLPRNSDTQLNAYLDEWNTLINNYNQARNNAPPLFPDIPESSHLFSLLCGIFDNSPYLSTILKKEIPFFHTLLTDGYETGFQGILHLLQHDVHPSVSQTELCRTLRVAKRRAGLLIALADISGFWSLDEVTSHLSSFADSCLRLTVRHLLFHAHQSGEISCSDLENPENGSGLIILAMGKLGAGELNYSSDIDLILFFDESKLHYTGRLTVHRFFIRLAQNLTTIMQDRTRDGYVFRIDLRLRPDPGSTPAAVSLSNAESYYENLGQNWERAAMIKHRFVAGDPETGAYFSDFIIPFIWRKSLDFYSIQDIHSIKRQIDSKQGDVPENLYNYNIKLGGGGIREIEFFVQTQQLIFGGRRPVLRVPATCQALQALVTAGEIEQKTCNELEEAYCFYRTVEHRLQMVGDHQTHSLPDNDEQMECIAHFLGFADTNAFTNQLRNHIATVQAHYSTLFDSSPSLTSLSPNVRGNLVFTGSDDDPSTVATLEKMGFESCSDISQTIRGWHHGRYRATRTYRARELLTELMPLLLDALARTVHPTAAFLRFDDFLQKLPSGIQIFSLFYNNPRLLQFIANIMGGYPYIAQSLNRTPSLLDYVLAPEFYERLPNQNYLEDHLCRALSYGRNFEDILNISRRWTHDQQFRAGIQFIQHNQNASRTAASLSAIADVTTQALYREVVEDFQRQYGEMNEGEFAVVAFGKLGGNELTFGSDLDLVFLYNLPKKENDSDGLTSLSGGQYYARLSRRFITAITASTHEGSLYEIDLRLRPSGKDGPMASSLEAFSQYYGTSAWAWEYMALTRARVIVASSSAFRLQVETTISRKLCRTWDSEKLCEHILDIHQRAHATHSGDNPFHLKYARGGLLDLEYICQYLQLRFAAKQPEILATNTQDAFFRLYRAHLLNDDDFSIVNDACILYSDLLCKLRLLQQKAPVSKSMTRGMQATLIENTGFDTFDSFEKKLVQTQKNVQNLFYRVFCIDPQL